MDTILSTLGRLPHAAGVGTSLLGALRQARRRPLVVWAGVLAVALFSFYVHLLNGQVVRGEKLREAQRAGGFRPAVQQAGEAQRVNHMVLASNNGSAARKRAAERAAQ